MDENSNKYYCEICDYSTSRLHNYNKHLLTLKHKHATNNSLLEINGNINNEKNVFSCDTCNFHCKYKSNYDIHLLSEKHKRKISGEPKENRYICSICNIEYTNHSGLWKHKKKCIQHPPIEPEEREPLQNTFTPVNNVSNFTPELFIEVMNKSKELQDFLIEQNKELQKQVLEQQNKLLEKDDMLIEQNNKIIELASKPTMVNSNNNNKTNFNLNFFLNETCKDAMNITDFINSIKLTTDDFETTGRLGFVNGISRIFVKELKKLTTEKLPLHCTDFKRETVYIKNNDTWEKENDEKTRFKWAIDRVAQLNLNQVRQWQIEYPGCVHNNTRENEKFTELASVALGGRGKEQEDKFREKIMKNVLKEVVLDKK